MQVRVHFFGQLRDVTPAGEMQIDLRSGATVADLLEQLYARHPRLQSWDRTILVGVGVEFVERSHLLQPNEQIAIMPPVQGG